MDSVPTSNISKGNKLLKCGALVVTQLLGMKEIKNKKKEESFWKRRIESKTNVFRKDVSLIEKWERGIKSEDKIGIKGYNRAAEELKQRIKAKAATKNRVQQYWDNKLFQSNQSKFFQELAGKSHEENIIWYKEKTRAFWSENWEKDIKHNESAD